MAVAMAAAEVLATLVGMGDLGTPRTYQRTEHCVINAVAQGNHSQL